MSAPIAVVTTVATHEQAQALARALVELRLAACVQLSAIESVYRWDGAVQAEPEWRVLRDAGRDRSTPAPVRRHRRLQLARRGSGRST